MAASINGQTSSWQEIGLRKREEIQGLLPAHWKIDAVPSPMELKDATQLPRKHLSPSEIDITETHSAIALLGRIAAGELNAVDVTKAFCHRATIAHQLVLNTPTPEPRRYWLTASHALSDQLPQRGRV
jgi:amidase